ncbi:MAG TPA: zinc dependent phospholipase C family protein [Terriglobales bacterium]|nr:zinc dependent phospholipase C family protein [Terriglobales bacterium]
MWGLLPKPRRVLPGIFLLLFVLLAAPFSVSYSVLSHEEVVDLVWADSIRPWLIQRFPNATRDDLRRAHAYAYGGCLIQDMGYYPFGNKRFSDLTHYVRSGDFVEALFAEAHDLNELAFALGALAHYASDLNGHPYINRAVAVRFPKLRQKYGDYVTYEDDPKAHIRTEFGFDVTQVAKNRFASDRYHDFIGFQVATPLLERAFKRTYGINLTDLMSNEDLAIGTYRRGISKVIPEMTKVALLIKPADLVHEKRDRNQKRFLYHVSRSYYEREWGSQYRRPGFGARFLAMLFHLIPKFGPFKAVDFVLPNTQTEDMYLKSMDVTLAEYRRLIGEVKAGKLQLNDRDFDTGRVTRAGEYKLTDDTYAALLDGLARRNFDTVTPELRNNILAFYANLNAPIATKKHRDKWARTLRELQGLKAVQVVSTPAPAPAD